jgi:hypothetical protein
MAAKIKFLQPPAFAGKENEDVGCNVDILNASLPQMLSHLASVIADVQI